MGECPPLRNRWFADSPLEGTGFEPSVPLLRKVSRLSPKGDAGPISWMGLSSTSRLARRRWSAAGPLHGRLFLGGTDGSNPVPSSGESAANLTFGARGKRLFRACA